MDVLGLYHALPPWLRSVVVSARGWQLQRWRYGQSFQQELKRVRGRRDWNREQWKRYRDQRLSYILNRAVHRVPFYRDYWQNEGTSQADWKKLEHWPVLDKEAIRSEPKAFLADDVKLSRLRSVHTSGTTGKPLHLWRGKDSDQRWHALFEARWRETYSVSVHERWAMLGGQLVVPVTQKKPPFWVKNWPMRQLYMSSYHLSPDNLPHYLDALEDFQPVYLWGYASSLYALAHCARQSGRDNLSFKVVISNAEPLYAHQRETIQRAFDAPVRDTYGSAEIVVGAHECDRGHLHLWPDAGVVEVLDDANNPISPGEKGRLICTGLVNDDMPLVRYDLGDVGAVAPDDFRCPCGGSMPVLLAIEGRNDDLIITPDGRQIGRLDPVFKADIPIREAQIIQESPDLVRIRYVAVDGFQDTDARALIRRLKERIGDIEIVLERVEAIERTANGKFRAVISGVTDEEGPVKETTEPIVKNAYGKAETGLEVKS